LADREEFGNEKTRSGTPDQTTSKTRTADIYLVFFTFESAAVAWADAKEFVFPEAAIRLPITADPAPCDRERRDPSQEQNPWTVRPAARIRLRRVPFATSL
jgi:hypothetical protein